VPDLTTEVTEFRERLDAIQWDAANAFPRMAGYVDIPCERILKRTLDLVRVHADQISTGDSRRLLALCRVLRLITSDSAWRGLQVYRRRQYVDGKPPVDLGNARQQARWLGWLIRDALKAGRDSRGRETDLAVDVLGLIRELVQDMPWERLTKSSLQHRVGLVRWFGEEVERLTAPPGWRPGRPSSGPSHAKSVPSDSAESSRDAVECGCVRSVVGNA
jgi:hypothetical protein